MVLPFAAFQNPGSATASGLIAYLTTISAIGLITMALIQTVKDMTPLRRVFQRAKLRRWLMEGVGEASEPARAAITRPADQAPALDAHEAERRIIAMATDGDGDALYDLPIEQMCGQINAALQVVAEYPRQERLLLEIVGSQARPEDVALMARDGAAVEQGTEPTQAYSAAKSRVIHQFQRAVDAFQIATSYRWKAAMQWASLGLCAVLTGVALAMGFDVGVGRFSVWGAIVVGAVLAGFLAPVARDLTAAIQSLRK
jgi:hypothetical protein